MKPAIKERWIAALESGEYPQAKTQLKSEEGFCCLGVLVKACEAEIKEKHTILETEELLMINDDLDILPASVLELLGLTPDQADKLMNINDANETVDFTKQVEYIRENL